MYIFKRRIKRPEDLLPAVAFQAVFRQLFQVDIPRICTRKLLQILDQLPVFLFLQRFLKLFLVLPGPPLLQYKNGHLAFFLLLRCKHLFYFRFPFSMVFVDAKKDLPDLFGTVRSTGKQCFLVFLPMEVHSEHTEDARHSRSVYG